MAEIIVIAHNLRSSHNVGSLFRTCEGLGVKKLYLTGYSPYPLAPDDNRLPHISAKLSKQIEKTALGTTEYLAWEHHSALPSLIKKLRSNGFEIVALEQSKNSVMITEYVAQQKTVLIVGNEKSGIDNKSLAQVDLCLEIPMFGKKESFNVVQAAAMALYSITFKLN